MISFLIEDWRSAVCMSSVILEERDIEVFLDGEFQFSADTMQEAYSELKAG